MAIYKELIKIEEQNHFWIVIDNGKFIRSPKNEELKRAKLLSYNSTNICPICREENHITEKSILYPRNALRECDILGNWTGRWICERHNSNRRFKIYHKKYKIFVKIEEKNQFWVVSDNKGNLTSNPTKKDLNDADIKSYNETNICHRCREENHITEKSILYPVNARHDIDQNGRPTNEWICKHHYDKNYQRYVPDSHNNIIKSLADCRIGNLNHHNKILGNNCEELTEKWLGAKRLSLKYDNYGHLPNDSGPITKHSHIKIGDIFLDLYGAIPQTKGRTYSSNYGYWNQNVENEFNKNFDYLIFYCFSEDGNVLERIYIIPRCEIGSKSITIVKNLAKNLKKGSIYDKYKIVDQNIVKQVGELWQNITKTNNGIIQRSSIRLEEDKIAMVSKRISDKTGVKVEKAERELKIGIINAILLNRHRSLSNDN